MREAFTIWINNWSTSGCAESQIDVNLVLFLLFLYYVLLISIIFKNLILQDRTYPPPGASWLSRALFLIDLLIHIFAKIVHIRLVAPPGSPGHYFN